MSHTETVGSQLASYPTERLTPSLAGPKADVSQQVAGSARRPSAELVTQSWHYRSLPLPSTGDRKQCAVGLVADLLQEGLASK